MNGKHLSQIAAAAFAACILPAFSAENPQGSMHEMMRQHHGAGAPQQGMMMDCPMMHGGAMGGGMMGGGMMGGGMMGGGMMRGGMMPPPMMGPRMLQLPPGNEKLQLQMQAEIMQKVGEIVAKYAAQIR